MPATWPANAGQTDAGSATANGSTGNTLLQKTGTDAEVPTSNLALFIPV